MSPLLVWGACALHPDRVHAANLCSSFRCSVLIFLSFCFTLHAFTLSLREDEFGPLSSDYRYSCHSNSFSCCFMWYVALLLSSFESGANQSAACSLGIGTSACRAHLCSTFISRLVLLCSRWSRYSRSRYVRIICFQMDRTYGAKGTQTRIYS